MPLDLEKRMLARGLALAVLVSAGLVPLPVLAQEAPPPVQSREAPPDSGGAAGFSAPLQPAAPESGGFSAFLEGVKAEAAQRGIGPGTVHVLDSLAPIDRVIELDRRQPESTLTYQGYLSRVVTAQKIARGREMLAENAALLAAIERRYHVQPRFVVALWGMESDYGRLTGSYPVLGALATLAWEGRRASYFRGELLNALAIVDQGNIGADQMLGSWAGAMGQCQFMPSTYLHYAQDWDGDGRRDIWTDRGDILASAAHYLAQLGWKGDQIWGRAVRVPPHIKAETIGLGTRRSLAQWARAGVRTADGTPLPRVPIQASLILADGQSGPAFLVYDNFRSVMKWNRSTLFALAVGRLADEIGDR